MYHVGAMHVIGIDAGGTKTVCLLADGDGRIVGESRARGANLQADGELEVEKVLHAVMEDAVGARDLRPDAVCIGIAGVDRPKDSDAIAAIMRRLGFRSRTLIVNDALVALVAGAGDQPGVVIVAGTGSIAYGRDADGRAARAGGWGYLLGDEGGGFWIARTALMAVVRQFDGRGPATALTDLVLRRMGVGAPAELIQAVYDPGMQRRALAGMAVVVEQAAEAGDAVAREILRRAADELAAAAASVISRLGMRGDAFPTILAGGVLLGMPSLSREVSVRVSEAAPRTEVRPLRVEPAVGAVALALRRARGQVALPSYV